MNPFKWIFNRYLNLLPDLIIGTPRDFLKSIKIKISFNN